MDKKICVSVVIPNLNGELWLKDCVNSILSQLDVSLQIILIDNGSTDRSIEIINALEKENSNISSVLLSENTGFSAAVNTGIKAAKNPYVLLFNNDAFAEPDMLCKMVKVMGEQENIFSVNPLMVRHYERQLADDAGDYVTILGWACKRGDGLLAKRYNKQQRIFSSCGGAALYNKNIIEQLGYFDEHFFAYLEDVDISWRANNEGYINIFCPVAVCYHICSATTGSKYNDFKALQSGRNNILLPYKNMPLLMLILNAPFLVVGYIIKVLFFYIRGYGKPFMAGFKEAFTVIPKLNKPKVKLSNLKNYLYCEISMIVGMFTYIDYRIRRYFNIS